MQQVDLASNPLKTRQDVLVALHTLWLPLSHRIAKEGARVDLGTPVANYGLVIGSLESVVRPLWGLAPAAAGGADFVDWATIRQAITEGTDESNPAFWGAPTDHDQRVVEYSALAVAIFFCEAEILRALAPIVQQRLVRLLERVNDCTLHDNNWLLFRVVINSVLQISVNQGNPALIENDLDRIDAFYLSNGWFSDGKGGKADYYSATVFHLYSLLHVVITRRNDERATTIKKRAKLFVPQFAPWFSLSQGALPFGRSLTYRFAPAAFWGVFALADIEGLDWGCIRNLFLDNLRWWLKQPIFVESGLLSVGYGYPNWWVGESYNSAGSPYWAFKAFLPLALPAEHPFWKAEEKNLEVPAVVPQPEAGLLLCHDKQRDHVWALSANSAPGGYVRHSQSKYAKFAYSTAFGFSVPLGDDTPTKCGSDNTLMLSVDQSSWRSRNPSFATIEGAVIYSLWKPWADVIVETWMTPASAGHVRVHRVRSKYPLQAIEGGFSLDRSAPLLGKKALAAVALMETSKQLSIVYDLTGVRNGIILMGEPLAHILYPLSATPALFWTNTPGVHWFATLCVGHAKKNGVETAEDYSANFKIVASEPEANVTFHGERILTCRSQIKDGT